MNPAAEPTSRGRWNLSSTAALALTLGVALLVASPRLDAPFDDSYQGFNESNYAHVALNFSRYGVWNLRGAMCCQPLPVVDTPPVYVHHPPLTGLALAGAFALFGATDRVVHAVELAQCLGVVAACFALARGVLGGSAWLGALAGVLTAAAPVFARFGMMIDPLGCGLLVPLLLAVAFTARWSRRGLARDLALANACLVAAYATDVSAFAVPVLLAAWALWARGRAGVRAAAAFLGVALVAGVGVLAWLAAVDARFGPQDHPFHAFLQRVGAHRESIDGAVAPVATADFLRGIAAHCIEGFTAPYFLAGAAAAAALAVAVLRRRVPAELGLLLVPVGFGALFVGLMPQGAYVHAYWPLSLAPAFALAIAALAHRALALGPTPRRLAIAGAAAVAVAMSACGALASRRDFASRAPTLAVYRDAGAWITEHTDASQTVIATLATTQPLAWYVRRNTAWATRDLSRSLADLVREPVRMRRIGAVVVDRALAPSDAPLLRDLGMGEPREFGDLAVWVRSAPPGSTGR